MMRDLLLRGLVAGLVASLLAFSFAKMFGEPYVDRAITFEKALDRSSGHRHNEPVVSRGVQSGIGLFTGLVVYGAALGGLFALAFAFAHGRLGQLGPQGVAGLITLAGFVAIVLVPGLKYPANPPAVGEFQTIGHRTVLFFWTVALSVSAMAAAILAFAGIRDRLGDRSAAIVAAMGYTAAVGLVCLLLPSIDEVPDTFPATLLWNFRIAAFGVQAVLWAALGAGFAGLAERVLRGARYALRPASPSVHS